MLIAIPPKTQLRVFDYHVDYVWDWKIETIYMGPRTWMHEGKRWWPCGWVGYGDYCAPCACQVFYRQPLAPFLC